MHRVLSQFLLIALTLTGLTAFGNVNTANLSMAELEEQLVEIDEELHQLARIHSEAEASAIAPNGIGRQNNRNGSG